MKRPLYALVALLLIIAIGTSGYYFIEGWSLIDSFYMTIITITTVGYKETGGDLSAWGKLFTVGLILSGFGVAYIALSGLAALFIRGEFNSYFGRIKMEKEIKKLKGHFILAGFGRTGQVITDHLKHKNVPLVVIDNSETTLEKLQTEKIPFVKGDASDEETLNTAGIKQAKGFIAVVSSDASNAFAIMTAKGLNPNLYIMARALDSQNIRKLKMAGANKIIAPYLLGGLRIAHAVTHPHAADFIDVMDDVQSRQIEIGDFLIDSNSGLDGRALKDSLVREMGLIAVGIRKNDGQFLFQPSADTTLHLGDHLIVMGPSEKVEKLHHQLS